MNYSPAASLGSRTTTAVSAGLARAIGADEHLDEKLVTSCASWFEAVEEAYRSAGAIAERPPVPGHADAQTLLLARFGRRA